MPSASPSSKTKANRPRQKPGRWWRRLAILCVLLAIGAWLINGIIFRKVVHSQVTKVLRDLYLTGSFEVEGTLLSGVQINDAQLTGTRNVREISLREAVVDYRLMPLIKGDWGEGITMIHADQLSIHFDSAMDFPVDEEIEDRKNERKAEKEAKGKPSTLWKNLDALLSQNLAITGLNLDLDNGDKDLLAVEQLSLNLKSGNGKLLVDQITYPNGETSRDLAADISTEGEPVITIRQLWLAEQLSIQSLAVSAPPSPELPPTISGDFDLFGAHIAASQKTETLWKAEMESGSIDIAAVVEWLGQEIPISGIVDGVEVTMNTESALPIRGSVTAKELTYDSYATDSISANFAYADSRESIEPSKRNQLILQPVFVTRGDNTVSVSGEIDLATKDIAAKVTVEAGDLTQLPTIGEIGEISGAVSGTGTFSLTGGKPGISSAHLTATDLGYRGAQISTAKLNAEIDDLSAVTVKLDSSIDEENSLHVEGSYQLKAKSYDAKANLDLKNLSGLHQILAALEAKQRPEGHLALEWSGSGDIETKTHSGAAKVSDLKVKLDAADPVSGTFDLAYAPGEYRLSSLNLYSKELSISGGAQLAGERLDVTEMRLFNGELALARADVSLPLDLKKVKDLDSFLDQPGKVSVEVNSDKLKLADVMALAGQKAPVATTLDAKINIHGTLANPNGSGTLHALKIRSAKAADLAPADAHLNFNLGSGRLTLDGKLEHPEINPITIAGSTPLRFNNLDSLIDQNINLSFKLPKTELALAKKYVPDLTRAEGTVAAEIRVTGKPDSPILKGEVHANCPLLKFKAQKIPTLTDIIVAIRLDDQQVTVERCHGYLAGGKFNLSGKADFKTLTEPQLDLAVSARQILVHRDESISLRANSDLKVTGPLPSATLAGTVGITQSRFFREIEILPIGLPRSSPTPAAPSAPSFGSKREIGVTTKPLADWKLDVKVVTDDAFLVRSNLARADIEVDLHVGGTGAAPVPVGVVKLTKGRATLPFSELETTVGTLTFTEKTKFDPEINFRARSKVQDYEISLIAYGRLSDPKTIITSDPPLPETEAVSLLATGVKSSEFGNAEVIAGDAALLLIDKLRRKYGKGTPLERQPGSLRDVLSFKAGQIDPRTGKRAASASLEVTDNVFLLGNVDAEGDYRGLVKFIFRFK